MTFLALAGKCGGLIAIGLAAAAVGAAPVQERLDRLVRHGEEIPEDVHLAPGSGSGELAAGNDPDARGVARRHSFGHTGH